MLETVDSILPKCYNAIAFTGGAVGEVRSAVRLPLR